MHAHAWITLTVLLACIVAMAATRIATDVVLLTGVTLLFAAGVLNGSQILGEFANEGIATIGFLYVVAAGLRETGGMSWVAHQLLGRPGSLRSAQVRIMGPISVMSAFLNNTPLVAMMLPVIHDWAKQIRFPASRLLIPLSYASIFGGACTLIGTSSNLIVNGELIKRGHASMSMFELAQVGIPAALVGIGFILLLGRWLLPDRSTPSADFADPRQYTIEMKVEENSPLVGKTIEQAGLRSLESMFLAEIWRDDQALPAVSPSDRLQAHDQLVFVGVVDSVRDLQKIRGLGPATDQVFKLDAPRSQRCLVEAVVSDTCPLVGKTVREGQFRTNYNAAVIAVSRQGARINRKIGDIILRSGDTLLLETHEAFLNQHRNNRDFFLVSRVANSRPPQHERAWVAVAILAAFVVAVAMFGVPVLLGAMIAAGLMIGTRCCRATVARRAVDWQVLISLAAALAIAKAMDLSGLAEHLGHHMLSLAGDSRWRALVLVYVLTAVLSNVVTAKAGAVLVLPIAFKTAADLSVSPLPYIVTVMFAAATALATPIAFPTNLMILGPGGYRFSDFLRIGIPLTLALGVVGTLLIPWFWPFVTV